MWWLLEEPLKIVNAPPSLCMHNGREYFTKMSDILSTLPYIYTLPKHFND